MKLVKASDCAACHPVGARLLHRGKVSLPALALPARLDARRGLSIPALPMRGPLPEPATAPWTAARARCPRPSWPLSRATWTAPPGPRLSRSLRRIPSASAPSSRWKATSSSPSACRTRRTSSARRFEALPGAPCDADAAGFRRSISTSPTRAASPLPLEARPGAMDRGDGSTPRPAAPNSIGSERRRRLEAARVPVEPGSKEALKGHGFSRTASSTKSRRALAPKGCSFRIAGDTLISNPLSRCHPDAQRKDPRLLFVTSA